MFRMRIILFLIDCLFLNWYTIQICQELEDEKRKHAQDTAQGDDVTYMLEKERERLKQEVRLVDDEPTRSLILSLNFPEKFLFSTVRDIAW